MRTAHISLLYAPVSVVGTEGRQALEDVDGIGQLIILFAQFGGLFGLGAVLLDLA